MRPLNINQVVQLILGRLKQVRIGILAELALKVAPKECRHLGSLFALHFELQPVFDALVVDEANRP